MVAALRTDGAISSELRFCIVRSRLAMYIEDMLRIALTLLLVASCTRADKAEKEQPSEEPAAARSKPAEKVTHDRVLLAPYMPAKDRLTVLLRIDRLAELGLDTSADAIMAPLPDYQRVFGGAPSSREANLADQFDIVAVSTSDPRYLTATTLSARVRDGGPAIRETLMYPGSGVTWQQANDRPYARFATTERFAIPDPRVYFVPDARWIVLVETAALGSLLPDGGRAGKPEPWLGRLEEMARLGEKRHLLGAFEARRLDEKIVLPNLGVMRLPSELGVVLEGRAGQLSFSGWLRFAQPQDAERFLAAGKLLQQLAHTEQVAQELQRYGALQPVRDLQMSLDGDRITWRTRVTVADVRGMAAYGARMAALLMTSAPAPWARGPAKVPAAADTEPSGAPSDTRDPKLRR